jgi:hypothetical protein
VKHLRWALLGVVALVLCAVPVAVAKPAGGAAISPVHSAGGLSGSELFGAGWAAQLENPPDAFAGACMPLGKHGKIAVPVPNSDLTASCTLKPGTPVYIFFGTECSNVEDPPFFGADATAQRACALAFDEEFFVAASITVDGGEPVDLLTPRFEVFSPQMTVDLPPDNILGVPAQTATFVAHGWAVIVRGLRPGEHTITVTLVDADGGVTTVPVTITIVPRGHAD